MKRIFRIILLLFLAAAAFPGDSIIQPVPEPFSLNFYDARQAAAVISRALFLVRRIQEKRITVRVNSVEIYFEEKDVSMPVGHQYRFNLLVNGEALDWEDTYVEYNGKMTNLRLLFTYRNQHPPSGLLYHLHE
ncbi:MAG: hypothetical protein ACLFST_05000 [Spirochaetia bacterium]